MIRVAQVEVPERLWSQFREWEWSVAWQYGETATTWRLAHPGGQVCYLKLKSAWNLGPGLEELFFSSYGAEVDPQKISFHRLLYDLIS